MPAVDEDPDLWRPPPDDARLWRYIDFPKYVSMLTCRGLWFSRSDLLGDPFEGAMSWPAVVERREMFTQFGPDLPMAIDNYELLRAAAVKWVYVNCWHLSPHESAAIWR